MNELRKVPEIYIFRLLTHTNFAMHLKNTHISISPPPPETVLTDLNVLLKIDKTAIQGYNF